MYTGVHSKHQNENLPMVRDNLRDKLVNLLKITFLANGKKSKQTGK